MSVLSDDEKIFMLNRMNSVSQRVQLGDFIVKQGSVPADNSITSAKIVNGAVVVSYVVLRAA